MDIIHLFIVPPFMALRIGQILRGAKGSYELLCPLKGSTVFKAKALSPSLSTQAKWYSLSAAAVESMSLTMDAGL